MKKIEKTITKNIKKVSKAAKKNPVGTFGVGAAAGTVMAIGAEFIAIKVASVVIIRKAKSKSEKKKDKE